MNYRLFVYTLIITLSACTVTGPADDGYDNLNEWVDNGRLLSDETKSILSTDSAQLTEEALDYNAYQQWQNAKKLNTTEYRKFKQWQEFEAYHQWKQQQAQ